MCRVSAACLVAALVVPIMHVFGPSQPAQAGAPGGGKVVCTPYGGCIVVAQQPGGVGSGGGSGSTESGAGAPSAVCVYPPGSGNAQPCFDPVLGWLNTDNGCRYLSIPTPAPGAGVFTENGSAPAGDGTYYLQTCMGIVGPPPGAVGSVQLVWWLAAPPTGFGGAIPAPAILAERAVALLGLTGPQIELSPPATSKQVVGLPTWMWTRINRATWATHNATAAVPGESVTATARAVSISWSMGDGNTVVCANPGTPYSSADTANESSPTCGYTYQTPSSGSPDGAYRVTGTTTWRVSWAGAGTAGQLTLQRPSSVLVVVAEAEAVNQ